MFGMLKAATQTSRHIIGVISKCSHVLTIYEPFLR